MAKDNTNLSPDEKKREEEKKELEKREQQELKEQEKEKKKKKAERDKKKKKIEKKKQQLISKEKKRIKQKINFPYKVLFNISALVMLVAFIFLFFMIEKDIFKSLLYSFFIFSGVYIAGGSIMVAVYYLISEDRIAELEQIRQVEKEQKELEEKMKQMKEKEELESIERELSEREFAKKNPNKIRGKEPDLNEQFDSSQEHEENFENESDDNAGQAPQLDMPQQDIDLPDMQNLDDLDGMQEEINDNSNNEEFDSSYLEELIQDKPKQ